LRAKKAVVSKNHFFSAKTETGKKENQQFQLFLLSGRQKKVKKNQHITPPMVQQLLPGPD